MQGPYIYELVPKINTVHATNKTILRCHHYFDLLYVMRNWNQESLNQTWINFNPSMDKLSYAQ